MLFPLILSLVLVFGAQAQDESSAIEELIKDIDDTLETLKEGMPADYLETATQQIASDARDIIQDAGVKVTESQANVIIQEVAEFLTQDTAKIKNPLKFEVFTTEASVRLLGMLGEKLAELVQSGDTEDLYETVLAVAVAAEAVAEGIEDMDDLIKITSAMNDPQDHEDVVERGHRQL